jgi:hypothetical protein
LSLSYELVRVISERGMPFEGVSQSPQWHQPISDARQETILGPNQLVLSAHQRLIFTSLSSSRRRALLSPSPPSHARLLTLVLTTVTRSLRSCSHRFIKGMGINARQSLANYKRRDRPRTLRQYHHRNTSPDTPSHYRLGRI